MRINRPRGRSGRSPLATADAAPPAKRTPAKRGAPADRFEIAGPLRNPELALYREELLDDLSCAIATLRTMPPAVTFFGGARVRREDPYFELTRAIGRELARTGIPPRTGGGPGVMLAAPEGFNEGRAHMRANGLAEIPPAPLAGGFSPEASEGDRRTAAFNIVLPFEQATNPEIDHSASIKQFAFRKLALYENVRGMVVMPGGYGTLDELFEVWAHCTRAGVRDPLVAAGSEFWKPLLDTVRRVAVHDRRLIEPDAFAQVEVLDDPGAIVSQLASARGVRGFEEPPAELATRLAQDVQGAMRRMDELPAAVTFLGGERLRPDDPACAALGQVAESLSRSGLALRTGGAEGVSAAVCRGARAASPDAVVQGVVMDDVDVSRFSGLDPAARVRDFVVFKDLLTRHTRGVVAAPGGLGTLAMVFGVLTEVQTGKRPKIPIVLVGRAYWQPIFDAIKQMMLSEQRQLIAPADLDLVTIADDPAQIAQGLAAAGSTPP